MFSKILQSYLKFWAIRYLKRVKPQIIAITGSVGKTSAKEAIFEVLKAKFNHRVRKAEGNLNTETGVPLAILGFESAPTKWWGWIPIVMAAPFKISTNLETQILVLELAADKPGDIKYLTTFVKPTIAVLTAIGPAHLKAFGSLEKIIDEKTALLWALPADGWAIFNLDDENVRKVSYGGRYQKLTYAIHEEADLTASNIETKIEKEKPQTEFKIKGKIDATVISPTLGAEANVYASLAAAAIGSILGIPTNKIKQGLEAIRPESHRMNVLAGKNKTMIIDDCYNANPLSMRAALNVLADLKVEPGNRKIAVLGDMKELGKIAAEAHRLVGKMARQATKNIVTIGPLAKNYRAPHYFKTIEAASAYLLPEVRSGDIILIKASRSMRFENIVDALKK